MSNDIFDILDSSDFTGAPSGANWNQSFVSGESTPGTGRTIDSRAVVDRNGGITFGDPAGFSDDFVTGLGNRPMSYRRATANAPEQLTIMPTPVPAPEQLTVMPTPVPAPEQLTIMPTPVPAPEQLTVMPTPVPAPEQLTVMPTPVPAPEQLTAMPTPVPAPEQLTIMPTPVPAPEAVAPSFASPEDFRLPEPVMEEQDALHRSVNTNQFRFATPGTRNAIAPRNDSDHVHAPRPVNSPRSVTRTATPALTGSADNVAGRAGEARKLTGRSEGYVSPTDTDYVPGLKNRKVRSDGYVSPADTDYAPGLKNKKVLADSYISPTDRPYEPGLKNKKVLSSEVAPRNEAAQTRTAEGVINPILREMQTLTPEQIGRIVGGLGRIVAAAATEYRAGTAEDSREALQDRHPAAGSEAYARQRNEALRIAEQGRRRAPRQ